MVMQTLFFSAYLLLAFGAALMLVLVLGLSLHGERRWSAHFLPALPPLLCLGIAAGSLFSGRNLVFVETRIDLLSTGVGQGARVLQLITLGLLALSAARVLGAILRQASHTPAPGTPLYLAFLLFFISGTIVPCVLGTEPTFIHSIFYPGVLFTAAWCARREPLERLITGAKIGLYALMLGSLLAAVLWPSGAVQAGYKGLLPGIGFRLWGLGSNANSIGPLALLVFLLEVMQPTPGRWRRAFLLSANAAVFLLAQSKTTWLVLLPVAATLIVHQVRLKLGARTGLALLLALIATLVTVLLLVMVCDLDLWCARLLNSRMGENLSTLTGRTRIWDVAVNTWLDNPLFGYGPNAWGPQFRAAIGMPYAFSAHNQFLQTLSVAGALGLLGLLVYLGHLAAAAWRCAASTRGVSLALLLMVLLRCLSEAPLSVQGLINGDTLTHLLLFCIVLRAPQAGTRSEAHRRRTTNLAPA